MNFLEMMREGGPLALVAMALGVLGTIFGVIAVVVGLGGSRSGFGLGVTTLIFAILASGAGVGGTLIGKQQVEAALVMVDSDVDRDLILRAGHKEASGAATLGAFAALLPLVLGALAALAGARAASSPQRRQGIDLSPTEAQGSETSGRAVLAVVFIGIAALAASGAWVTGHRPPPAGKFDFDIDDRDAWDLARAVNDVERKMNSERNEARDYDANIAATCTRLAEAFRPYWKTTDWKQWPRKFDGIPPSLTGWKEAANQCIEFELGPHKSDGIGLGERVAKTTDELLESPLLQDEKLKARVLAREEAKNEPADPPGDAPPNEPVLNGPVDRNEIQRVIRSHLSKVTYCYEKELTKNPTLEGKLLIELTISATGAVSHAAEADGPFPDKRVSDCVVKEIEKLKFPAPLGGGIVKVRYPFVFKAAK